MEYVIVNLVGTINKRLGESDMETEKDMTVKELIEQLKTCRPDAPVMVYDGEALWTITCVEQSFPCMFDDDPPVEIHI
jgi:hypothetical protein